MEHLLVKFTFVHFRRNQLPPYGVMFFWALQWRSVIGREFGQWNSHP